MKRIAPALAVLALALAAAPATSNASRPATAGEVARAGSAGYFPAECFEFRTSTEDAKYVVARDAPSAIDGDPLCIGLTDGYVVFRIAPTGGVERLAEGSDPGAGDRPCTVEIPPLVGGDLGVCDGLPKRVLAQGAADGAYKPRTVRLRGRNELVRARWSSWSRSRAKGTATLDIKRRRVIAKARVRVTLSRPTVCRDGSAQFTRVSLRAVRSADRKAVAKASRRKSLPRCPQP